VKVYSSKLPPTRGVAPAIFSTFQPYGGDQSGVSLAAGLVDFASGRNSIVTAPGAGSAGEVKMFVFPLLTALANGNHAGMSSIDKPVKSASFFPFGNTYNGGVSLGTGWLAGQLGGAQRVVVSQLSGRGTVKIFSTGSALDGGPSMYLHNPSQHDHSATFREIGSFDPFAEGSGTRIATSSTTTGANLLVSGSTAEGSHVLKFDFLRADAKATTLKAVSLGEVPSLAGSRVVAVAGN
jgi:hypothetical protein